MASGRIQLRRLNRPVSPEVAFLQDSVQMALEQIQAASQFKTSNTVNNYYGVGGPGTTWNRLTTHMPDGAPACVANYQFDGTSDALDDRTGTTAHNLQMSAGDSEMYIPVDGVLGFGFDTTRYLITSAYCPNLELCTRATTIEVVVCMEGLSGTPDIMLAYGGTTDAASHDVLFSYAWDNSAGRVRWLHEASAGAIVDGTNCVAYGGMVTGHGWVYLATTRDTDGMTIDFYQDGQYIMQQTVSAAHPPDDPATGTSRKLAIGADAGGVWPMNGVLSSVRITQAKLTYEQIQQQYRRLRGIEP